jgi:hypothetical protein
VARRLQLGYKPSRFPNQLIIARSQIFIGVLRDILAPQRGLPIGQSVWLQDDDTQSKPLTKGKAFTPAAFSKNPAKGFPACRQPKCLETPAFSPRA